MYEFRAGVGKLKYGLKEIWLSPYFIGIYLKINLGRGIK